MDSHYKTITLASILVALSGILYGFMGYFGTRIMQGHIPIYSMLFWRFLLAGIWISFFVLKKYSVRDLLNAFDKHALLTMFILGSVSYAGASGFYFVASQYTGTGLAMVIFFSYPIFVACSAWIMRHQPFCIRTALLLLTMTAGLFMLSDTHAYNVLGIFFSLMAALSYASYIIGTKRSANVAIDSTVFTMLVCFGCAFFFLIISLMTHQFTLPTTFSNWGYIFFLSILITALPIQLMLEGLKHISSLRASIISVLEPLVTFIVGISLLHESVTHLQLLGAVVVLTSALVVQFQRDPIK